MKRCPFCAEEIQDEAVKCRYCHEVLTRDSNDLCGIKKQNLANYKLATRYQRLVGVWLDNFIVAASAMMGTFIFGDIFAFLALYFVIGYVLFRDGIEGKGIGKRLVGIKVISEKTWKEISFGSSFVRSLTLLIPFVNLAEYITIICNEKNKRIGDMMAGTIVVSEKEDDKRAKMILLVLFLPIIIMVFVALFVALGDPIKHENKVRATSAQQTEPSYLEYSSPSAFPSESPVETPYPDDQSNSNEEEEEQQ